jgi:major membrane immunogen (membrane-anchored lipoprotein)
MKKLLCLTFLVATLILVSCGDSDKDDSGADGTKSPLVKDRKYGIKSAIIEYDVSGSQEGSRRLYFDNWGARQAEYSNTTITVGQFSKTANLLNITDGDWQYTINMDSKSGTKSKSSLKELKEELMGQQYFNELGEQAIIKMGGMKLGTEEYLGKECTVYEFRNIGMRAWYWKWILLKSETRSGPVNIIVTARKIEEDVRVPEDRFRVPEDITLNTVDLDDIEGQMRREQEEREKEK